MRTLKILPPILFLLFASFVVGQQQPREQKGPDTDWKTVEQAIGKSGAMQTGDVYKFSFPRTDLQVTAAGVHINPALALGAWVAFKKHGTEAMVMGDLVLTENEVSAVMSKLQDGGIEITALHNHILHESPRIMYMHVGAIGTPDKLAQTIHSALAATGTPMATAPPGAAAAAELDVKQIDSILGQQGKMNNGVLQYSVARAEPISEHGMEIPPSMGTATAINFQSTEKDKAAITGDFVLRASEVNNVIRELRKGGIAVTALHSHMLDEEPRLFFMHFWANDDPQKLARALRAALEKTRTKR